MGCSITIDPTTLVAVTDDTGAVISMGVAGGADGCAEIVVSVHDNSAGIDIGSQIVTTESDGSWRAEFGEGFDFEGVDCGLPDKMRVEATCLGHPRGDPDACHAEIDVQLRCEPGGGVGCPEVTVEVIPGLCNADNTERTMTFKVTVADGEEIQYRWNFGDGPLTPLATGSGVFDELHTYAAGATYNANLIIMVPPVCTATPDPIIVQVTCEGAPCPKDPVLVAERHVPGGQRVLENIDADCIPAGDYTLSASNGPVVSGLLAEFPWARRCPGRSTTNLLGRQSQSP